MLRVRTKWYNAFNTGQISVLGSSMWGCGGAEKQGDRNSITLSPLLSSPLLPSLRFLISSHFLAFVSSPSLLSSIRPSFPQISPHIFPRCPHLFSSPILSHFLALVSYLIHPSLHPAPASSPFLWVPLPFLLFLICPCSPISKSAYIFKTLNNFKHSDRKHWNTYCSPHKDT